MVEETPKRKIINLHSEDSSNKIKKSSTETKIDAKNHLMEENVKNKKVIHTLTYRNHLSSSQKPAS